MLFKGKGWTRKEWTGTDLEDALRRVDHLTWERDHALTLLTAHQRTAFEGSAPQTHLLNLVQQRDVQIADQQERLLTLQQRIQDLEEEVQSSHAATLYCRAEASTAIRELQIAAVELEATNKALQVANERLVTTLRCAQAGTCDWDMVENRARWSEEFYNLHGLDPGSEPATDQIWYGAMHPEDQERGKQTIQDWLERRKGDIDLEYRIHHPAKGLRWLALTGRILYDPCGGPCRMMGLVIDITDRKQAETRAQEAQAEAERANAAKSRFLAAASHDIRQPIQAAALFLGLLEKRDLDQSTRDLVSRLTDAVSGVQGMLEGLLDLARLEACMIVPDIRDIALDDLLRHLAVEFGGIAEAAGLWLRVPMTGRIISTDALLLERILRNLVANGLKYTERGGVTIECQEVEEGIRITVNDTGCGIPVEQLDAIFEEFIQLDNPARNRAQGFGLGLAIVEQTARRLGHRLAVSSKPNEGSSFSLTVPLSRSVPDLAPELLGVERRQAGSLLKGRTIIVIEDDPAIQLALDMLLQDWGLKVLIASSLEELDALLNELQSPPDLMLADYRLPGGTCGTDAIELAHLRWPVPAVLMTGDTAPERLEEARRSGCRLLHKPVNPADLRRTLNACL
ncbi:hypothetical protein SAE02_71450 [Skermanella aerolata]|uniref:histidine kinase n=1 Tax=Skermanella aerolata TaxID=393310 RepID=A0A512E2R8_9PROT|nr:ATP-binding protein [Skermanella aerolata]KJB90079.1 hypothetical protein N826_36835 [Skermanella aerolata KACC 11604]GEO42997.1 hypothetical protein SAE02_71450 [Skermanella aerolata]